MGYEKFKRPIWAPKGLRVGGSSADPNDGVGSPTITGQVRIPSSGIQTIASTASAVSTAAALTPIATYTQVATITTTGSGAGYEVKLTTGRAVGTSVLVSVSCNSTVPVTLLLESTTQVLFGSTFNALTWSTDSSGTAVTLTKVSTGVYTGVWDAAKVSPAASTGTV